MLFGDPRVFTIECHSEPVPGYRAWVFGRMCIRAGQTVLGDVEATSCPLTVTAGALERCLHRLDGLVDAELAALGDRERYDLLDRALYLDDERTDGQVHADAALYRRFDFLTNGGESLDHNKSFFMLVDGEVRVVFTYRDPELKTLRVPRALFEQTIRAFLDWVERERTAPEPS